MRGTLVFTLVALIGLSGCASQGQKLEREAKQVRSTTMRQFAGEAAFKAWLSDVDALAQSR